jgi:ribosomal protein L11 methyltransferase
MPPPPLREPRYPYVVIDVAQSDAERASALLFDLGARGVEERDASTLVPGASGGGVTLAASFETQEDARECMSELPEVWSPRYDEVIGDAWRDEWKKYFEPFAICPGVVVVPPWLADQAGPGETVLVLEPGRAFGTGLHDTTSLVAEALADVRPLLARAAVLDVGCGSGILSLLALKLGAAYAFARDIDPEAVAVTRENARRNGLQDRVFAEEQSVADIAERFPIVVANIEQKTLVGLAPDLIARVAEGGLLVLGGILAPHVAPTQLEDIRASYCRLSEQEVRQKGEWVTAIFRR